MILWDKQHIRTFYTFYAAWNTLWALALVTLWLLSDIKSMDHLWSWPCLLIPNVLMIPLSLVLLLNVQIAVPQVLIALSGILGVGVGLINIVALVWFALIWSECKTDKVVDFLCSLPNDNKLGIGYFIVTGAFILGEVIFFLALYLTSKRNHNGAGRSIPTDDLGFLSKKSEFHFTQWLHIGISFMEAALCVLIVEASILAPYSRFDFLWLCHLPLVLPAIASYVTLAIPHKDKVFLLISALGCASSSLGPVLMGVYYKQLCISEPPEEFAGVSTCDLGSRATVYFIVVHTLLAMLACGRVLAYALAVYLGTGSVVKRDEEITVLIDSEAMVQSFHHVYNLHNNYTHNTLYNRSLSKSYSSSSPSATVISNVTGGFINL